MAHSNSQVVQFKMRSNWASGRPVVSCTVLLLSVIKILNTTVIYTHQSKNIPSISADITRKLWSVTDCWSCSITFDANPPLTHMIHELIFSKTSVRRSDTLHITQLPSWHWILVPHDKRVKTFRMLIKFKMVRFLNEKCDWCYMKSRAYADIS